MLLNSNSRNYSKWSQAWQEIPMEMVKKSFKSCEISSGTWESMELKDKEMEDEFKIESEDY